MILSPLIKQSTRNQIKTNFSGKNKNKFDCICSEGLTGKLCNFEDRCVTEDPCLHGPCNPEDDFFSCDCSDTGFSGQTCGEDIDECELETDPCGDHGACFNTPGSFTCECDDGYSGIFCEIKDLCFQVGHFIEIFLNKKKVSCSDQGQCDPSTGLCSCNPGFLGEDCSKIDECFKINCMNNGTCFDGVCACSDGWYGPTCTIDESSYDPCDEVKDFCREENGRCVSDKKTKKATCECKFGFSGEKCVQVCYKNIF